MTDAEVELCEQLEVLAQEWDEAWDTLDGANGTPPCPTNLLLEARDEIQTLRERLEHTCGGDCTCHTST